MRNIRIIARRELAQYFTSPVAYLVAFAIMELTAWYFNADLAQRVGQQPPDGADVLKAFGFFMVFCTPLLTMRLFAEEAREGTLELMLTMPVRDGDIVLGKFLGAWCYYSLILALTLVYQAIWLALTTASEYQLRPELDIGPVISAYIGIWLFGGATLAIGMLFSAITENQIVAGFLSMAALLILWAGDLAGLVIPNYDVAQFVRQLSLQAHYSTSFMIGVIRFEDMVFFIGLIVVMVFITTRLIESRRWR
ncbi:MAG: ABC transporter permease subunit [Chloroflexi bacterium]|nr:ABC transporter permease subunit [Chloroflexota bacterium]